MANEQLLNYINQSRTQGVSDEQITQDLVKTGWTNLDIIEAFNSLGQDNAIQPEKTKSSHVKKIAKWLAIAIAVLVVMFFSFANLLSFVLGKDSPPTNDQDLQLATTEIPEQENSFYDLIKIENNYYEPADIFDHLDGKKLWDIATFDSVIARNSQAFAYFSNAAQKEKFQDLAFDSRGGMMAMTPLRAMARLLSVKSEYLFIQGRDKEALDEIYKLLKVGQQIEESQASFVHYLVAVAMKNVAYERIQKIVETTKLSSKDLVSYSEKLEKFYDTGNGLRNALKGEYLVSKKVIDGFVLGNLDSPIFPYFDDNEKIKKLLKNNFYFKPNQTKTLFAGWTKSNIDALEKPCGRIEIPSSELPLPLDSFKIYFTENAIGKLVYVLLNFQVSVAFDKRCESNLILAATKVLMAARAYKIDNGNLPNSLNDLSPKYISQIPIDPFDGKTIRYSPSKKIIYSIGKYLIDSGGSEGTDWKRMDNPTFKINF